MPIPNLPALLERLTTNDPELTSLTLYQITLLELIQITTALKSNKTLTSLNLDYCNIGLEKAKHIAQILTTNKCLKSLNLAGSGIGTQEIEPIAQALKVNQSLESLNLSGCSKIESRGAEHIADALKINKFLKSLNLSYCYIEGEGTKHIANMLEVNQSLAFVNLAYCNIGREGSQLIIQALNINKFLRSFNMSGCNVGTEEVKDIAETLKTNQSLTSLNLSSYHRIGPKGAKHIADALKINKCLKSLYLRYCGIKDEGAKDIAEMLEVNQSLTFLDLTNCEIGPEGARRIADALKINTCLKSLSLDDCNIGVEGINYIADALEVNDKLISLTSPVLNHAIYHETRSRINLKLKINQINFKAFIQRLDQNTFDPEYLKKHAEDIIDILEKTNDETHLRIFSDIIYSEFFKLIRSPLPNELVRIIHQNHSSINLSLLPLINILCDEWDTGIQSRINDKATHIYNGRYPKNWNDLGNTKIVSTLLQRASSWMDSEQLYGFGCKLAKSSLPNDHPNYREIIKSLPAPVQQGFHKPIVRATNIPPMGPRESLTLPSSALKATEFQRSKTHKISHPR